MYFLLKCVSLDLQCLLLKKLVIPVKIHCIEKSSDATGGGAASGHKAAKCLKVCETRPLMIAAEKIWLFPLKLIALKKVQAMSQGDSKMSQRM